MVSQTTLDCKNRILRLQFDTIDLKIELEQLEKQSGEFRTNIGKVFFQFNWEGETPSVFISFFNFEARGSMGIPDSEKVSLPVLTSNGFKDEFFGKDLEKSFHMDLAFMAKERYAVDSVFEFATQKGTIKLITELINCAREFNTLHISTQWGESEEFISREESAIEFMSNYFKKLLK